LQELDIKHCNIVLLVLKFKSHDESPELKHVAKNIKSVNECCCVDGRYICNFTINKLILINTTG